MIDKNMKPCPFCGIKYMIFATRNGVCNFRCDACLAEGPVAETEEEAAKLWNTRKGQ